MTIDQIDTLRALRRRLRCTEAVARLCAECSCAGDATDALSAVEEALASIGTKLEDLTEGAGLA